MKAGDWTIRDISVGPQTHRCSHHLFSVDSIDTQSYAFTVASQNNPLRGACEFKSGARFYRWNDEPEEPGYRPKLECKYHGISEGNLLLESQDGTRNGSVAFGAPAWDIRAVYDDSGFLASSSLVGYEIWSGATAIAAVETVGDGRIWIDPSLSKEDQQRVIGDAATLVLYDPPPRSPPDDCQ
jgi:hypothetical protein